MVFDLPRFESEPVLGIVRGLNESCLEGVVDAAFAGGLRFLEITLNTPDAFHLINKINTKYTEPSFYKTVYTKKSVNHIEIHINTH